MQLVLRMVQLWYDYGTRVKTTDASLPESLLLKTTINTAGKVIYTNSGEITAAPPPPPLPKEKKDRYKTQNSLALAFYV